jgi:hypothetical protein
VQREILTEFVHPVGPATTSDQVVRVSSLVENLISRLRCDFLLRRPLGSDDLTFLQFLLNRCRYPRSEDPKRIGKPPAEFPASSGFSLVALGQCQGCPVNEVGEIYQQGHVSKEQGYCSPFERSH